MAFQQSVVYASPSSRADNLSLYSIGFVAECACENIEFAL